MDPWALAWVVCLFYGVGALLWLWDYTRRVGAGDKRESLRRSLAGGAAVFMAFTGSATVLLFCAVLSRVVR